MLRARGRVKEHFGGFKCRRKVSTVWTQAILQDIGQSPQDYSSWGPTSPTSDTLSLSTPRLPSLVGLRPPFYSHLYPDRAHKASEAGARVSTDALFYFTIVWSPIRTWGPDPQNVALSTTLSTQGVVFGCGHILLIAVSLGIPRALRQAIFQQIIRLCLIKVTFSFFHQIFGLLALQCVDSEHDMCFLHDSGCGSVDKSIEYQSFTKPTICRKGNVTTPRNAHSIPHPMFPNSTSSPCIP